MFQVAVATTVAEEALSNVRTVRAFAMEDHEVDLYTKELQTSQRYNERLGLGIAGFQALSNIALNGWFDDVPLFNWCVYMLVLTLCTYVHTLAVVQEYVQIKVYACGY